MPKFHIMLAITVAALAVLVACRRGGDADAPDPAKEAAAKAFAAAEQTWRDQRRERLLAPDGWTSLIGLHWIDMGPHYVGSSANSGIRLSMGPPDLGLLPT